MGLDISIRLTHFLLLKKKVYTGSIQFNGGIMILPTKFEPKFVAN